MVVGWIFDGGLILNIYTGSNFSEFEALLPESWGQRNWVELPLEVLSYGGGTQSTAILVLIRDGYLPAPDLVLHADTGSELPETVAFLSEAKALCDEIDIPFIIVGSHRGSLHNDYLRLNTIPVIGTRSCTGNFKILPQRRFLREIVGNKRGKVLAKMWLGITLDEARRRSSHCDVKWTELTYPLLDDYPITRDQAIAINEKAGLTVGKSGCFCCPYAGSNHWFDLRKNHPELFEIAIKMEENKFEHRGGKLGLFQEKRLTMLDSYIPKEDSNCDSGAGCFL